MSNFMRSLSINKTPMLLVAVCSLVLLSACATTATSPASVEDRAKERWAALLSDDLSGAYEYLSPGYRSSVTSVQYQRAMLLKRVNWTNAEIRSSECEETVCNVRVIVGFSIYGGLPGVRSFTSVDEIIESWVLVDGIWYLVPE